MSCNTQNILLPVLRFPGFAGEWEEKTIGDIADVLQGFGFPDKYQGQTTGDLPFCKVGDISAAVDKGERIISHAANYVDYSLLPELHARPIPEGATIFAKIGEAIRSNKRIMTGCPCLIDNNAAAVKAKEGESDEFIFYLMSNVNLADYAGGIVPSVNKSTIETISVLIPPTIAEQKKIASCLSDIDSLIAAQSQIIAAVKEKKKGLIQQLFPLPGENTPRLRFPGFTGTWEEKKLTDLAQKINRRNRQFEVTRVLTNSANDGVVDQNEYFDRDIVVKSNTNNYYIVELNDFVYNPRISTSAPVGPISINKIGKGIMSPLYTVFKFYKGYVPFFAYYFQTNIWHPYLKGIANYGARFDRMNITSEGFFNMPLYVPSSIEEQQKIASCLSSLDDTIQAETEKWESMKAHKKGLMQQLFPQPNK